MLRLMLFRHAHADRPTGVADHDRPLSEKGHEQARLMGRYIRAQGLESSIFVVSTAKRTQETWAQACASGELAAAKVNEPRIYESTAGSLLEVVREQDASHASVMLVGHNPGLERLAAWLVGSADSAAAARLQREFAVGGLAVIDFPAASWAEIDAQGGHLERFETPESVGQSR